MSMSACETGVGYGGIALIIAEMNSDRSRGSVWPFAESSTAGVRGGVRIAFRLPDLGGESSSFTERERLIPYCKCIGTGRFAYEHLTLVLAGRTGSISI
jgi:hypothetical protein